MSGQLHAPADSPYRKEDTDTHCIGGWLGPTTSLDAVTEKNSLNVPAGKRTPVVQPILTELLRHGDVHMQTCMLRPLLLP